jgi:hypothetical protein
MNLVNIRKKDDALRRKELLDGCVDVLVGAFSVDITKYILHPQISRLLSLVIKDILEGMFKIN